MLKYVYELELNSLIDEAKRFSTLQAQRWFDKIVFAFPIHLILILFKHNLWLLLFWAVLFGFVAGTLGGSIGIPYLFLDPEYNSQISVWGFFFIGLGLGGFIMAYHITCYILVAYRYSFLGVVKHPFLNFAINNSPIPLFFLAYYLIQIARFQSDYERTDLAGILWKIAGLLGGLVIMILLVMLYFRFTNKNAFKLIALNFDKKLRRTRLQRANVMERINIARKRQVTVRSYFVLPFHFFPTPKYYQFDRESLLKVFDQNQLNALLLQVILISSILFLGVFRDAPLLQLPAAASALLLFTMLLMFAGAISYWLRSWASSLVTVGAIAFLVLAQKNTINPYHRAFGLSYKEKVEYSLDRINQLGNYENFKKDSLHTINILNNWRAKFPESNKPRMVLMSMSGGGQRAALWAMKSLQVLDSLTDGRSLENTMFISGSSGGLIGASYYRELWRRRKNGEKVAPNSMLYTEKLGLDKLNPMIFTLVVSDLFFRFQKFEVNGEEYYKDRAYSLEKKIHRDTDSLLAKRVGAYQAEEFRAEIPMLVISPTIVNDGRKLYISPQPVSYLNSGNIFDNQEVQVKVKGIEFRRFFEGLNPDSLQFVTALRMNATFPYITPNVMLPSDPAIEILDAGLSDNFGVTDVIRFLFVFREWIAKNTSGVVILTIRDTAKEMKVQDYEKGTSLLRTFLPFSILWENLQNQQDIRNDNSIEYAKGWFKGELDYVSLEYRGSASALEKKAALSWRLTSVEKQDVLNDAYAPYNQQAFQKLTQLLVTSPNSLTDNEEKRSIKKQ